MRACLDSASLRRFCCAAFSRSSSDTPRHGAARRCMAPDGAAGTARLRAATSSSRGDVSGRTARCPPGAMPHWRAPWAPAVSRPPPSSAPRRPAAPRPAWDVRCCARCLAASRVRSRARRAGVHLRPAPVLADGGGAGAPAHALRARASAREERLRRRRDVATDARRFALWRVSGVAARAPAAQHHRGLAPRCVPRGIAWRRGALRRSCRRAAFKSKGSEARRVAAQGGAPTTGRTRRRARRRGAPRRRRAACARARCVRGPPPRRRRLRSSTTPAWRGTSRAPPRSAPPPRPKPRRVQHRFSRAICADLRARPARFAGGCGCGNAAGCFFGGHRR